MLTATSGDLLCKMPTPMSRTCAALTGLLSAAAAAAACAAAACAAVVCDFLGDTFNHIRMALKNPLE